MHLEKVGLIRRKVKMVAEILMGKKRVRYSVLAVLVLGFSFIFVFSKGILHHISIETNVRVKTPRLGFTEDQPIFHIFHHRRVDGLCLLTGL